MDAEKISHFTQLNTWKKAHTQLLNIYEIIKLFPPEEKYNLIDQLRRAALSVTGNIAEGFGRFYFKDKIRFYYNARGSNYEILNCLIVARDLNYMNDENYKILIRANSEILKGLNGMISTTKKQLKDT